MLLVSYEFLLFFAVVTLFYYLVPGRFQWMILLGASYLFYLSGGWRAVCFILATTVSTWLLGLKLGAFKQATKTYMKERKLEKEEKRAYRAARKKLSWRFLLLGLLFNFGILGVLKYANFAIGNINGIWHIMGGTASLPLMRWLLPLGISYYTFQSMGYLIDVYRSKYEPEKNLCRFALFVSFFPQLVQGPISRFDEMKEQFLAAHPFDRQQVFFGLQRMLWGYFKKLVVADRLAVAVSAISQEPDTYGGIFVFTGMVCYTIQIYGDFTGGIDIVIGSAQVLGIRLPENFNRPYFSKTVGEYWRRWHMSLMIWFREYIFYPASVCQPVTRLTRWGKQHLGEGIGRRIPVYSASLLVWFVTGIWHGASWGFVFWGILNGLVLLAASELTPMQRRFHEKYPNIRKKKAFQVFQIARTMLILSMIQTLEYYQTLPRTARMLAAMIGQFSLAPLMDGRFLTLGLDGKDWLCVLAGTLLMLFVSLVQRKGSVRKQIAGTSEFLQFLVWFGLFLAVLVFGVYGQGFDASQFLYNQF